MPQLMPLSWVYSSIVLLLILWSAFMVYSEMVSELKVDHYKNSKSGMSQMWFW